MKLAKINVFFRKLAVFQLKYRFILIAVLAVLTAAGFTGVKKLHSDDGQASYIKTSREHRLKEDQFENLFGNNEAIFLLVEADDVFAPEVLRAIHEIGNELLEKVPHADSLTSITDMDIAIGTDEGMEVSNPFKDGIPTDPAELQQKKDFILSRQSLVNKLVSEDAKETWVVLSLTPYESLQTGMFEDGTAAIAVVTADKYKSNAYTIKAAGIPYTETEEKAVMNVEMARTIGISFVCMIVLLIVFSKSLRGTIVPVIATVMAIITVFGFMGHLGVTIYTSMVALPVILAMALSVGYSIHLINAFRAAFYQEGIRREAVIRSVENIGWPLLFTVITTAVSVLSFLTTELMPIRWVGAACAATVVAVYLYVAILIPILMSFGKDRAGGITHSVQRFQKIDDWFEWFGKGVIKKRKPLLIAFSLITAVCVPALFRIEVNMDTFNFLGTRIPYVKRIWDITHSQLGAYFNYNVMLTFDDTDALKDPEVLKKIDTLAEKIGSFTYTKKNNGVAKVFSVLDVVKEMNQTMHADDPAYYRLPDDRALLSQLLFLYEISGGDMSKWVDSEYRIMRINVDLSAFNGNAIVADLDAIKETAAALFPHADCFCVGPAVQFAEINNKIVYGELTSFIASLVAIAFLMVLVFGSLKMGFIGLIPNLMPLVTIGGLMGYLNIPLDMMTMTIMPMLLGIAVDDIIHFTNHTKYIFEIERSYTKAITETFHSVGKTLAMTTIILSVTFLSYISCRIDAMVRMGVLAAIGLISALAADYLVTPALIYMTHPFGRETDTETAEGL